MNKPYSALNGCRGINANNHNTAFAAKSWVAPEQTRLLVVLQI
jgi:hypothetical protein